MQSLRFSSAVLMTRAQSTTCESYSRTSKKNAQERGDVVVSSANIIQRQLMYLDETVDRDKEDPVRCSVFLPGMLDVVPIRPRKQRRPRHTWVGNVCKIASNLASSSDDGTLMASSTKAMNAWRATVIQYCNRLQ